MVERYVRASRFLSWVLRHDPGGIGLALDSSGWADIDELIDRAAGKGRALTREIIYEIVESDEKGRYELTDDLTRIRACYGHSLDVEQSRTSEKPPATLYHGTAARNLDAILRRGIVPGRRRFVHLSVDRETAIEVGRRHGAPVVLAVRAGDLFDSGVEFYRAGRDIWLVRSVPPDFIRHSAAGRI
jgi:putative RNA 2'-phosphotransferase